MIRDFRIEGKKIYVAGHRGLVGSAIVRSLEFRDCEIITATKDEVDLRRQKEVEDFLGEAKPDAVILAAALVGGILDNSKRPAEYIYDNLAIETSVIEGSRQIGVEKLLFLGSSCAYPKESTIPITEDALLSGPLEPTNQWYALAKISGLKMCQAYRQQYGCNFISAMPCNLYGPGDNFDSNSSHVIPALMSRMHEAKVAGRSNVVIWGSGKPRREFLYVDDLASATLRLLEFYSEEDTINVGTGTDISIFGLATILKDIIGFEGELVFDASKPDGTFRKVIDASRITNLGWKPRVDFEEGYEICINGMLTL